MIETEYFISKTTNWKPKNLEPRSIGTMLQTGRSKVRFPKRLLDFSMWPIPSNRTMVLGTTQPLKEMNTRNLHGGKRRSVRKADKITAICESTV
jgi:hypothetical protein